MKRKQIVLGLATTCFLVGTLAASPAQAAPPAGAEVSGGTSTSAPGKSVTSPGQNKSAEQNSAPQWNNAKDAAEWAQYVADQQARDDSGLTSLSQEIDQIVGDDTDMWQPGMKRSVQGYAAQVMSGASTLDLYWKGPLPAVIQQAIDAHPEVQVTVHQMAWDEDEMMTAQHLVFDRLRLGSVVPKSAVLSTVGRVPDMSGLQVELVGALDAQQVDRLTHQIAEWTKIPTTIVLTPGSVQGVVPGSYVFTLGSYMPLSRQNDTSPW